MFGYIKIKKEELLVKDYALYQSVYCGLCREIRKNISFFIPFSLSYDFVFLSIVRDMLTESSVSVTPGRCPYNPAKKKAFVSSDGIKYTARAALILIEKNIEDKRRDKDLRFLSPILWVAEKYLKRKIKKKLPDKDWQELSRSVGEKLEKFNKLELSHAGLDELGESFGEVLGQIISLGLDSSTARIGESVGRSVGAWLYLADAADDIDKDYKKKSFNPLLDEYKTPDEVRANFKKIDITFASLAKDAHLALSLADHRDYNRIADNILSEGLGQEAYRIMNKQRRKK